MDGLARRMVEGGKSQDKIDAMAIPEPYGDWLFASFFPVNMHFLYERWSERVGVSD